MEDTNRCIVRKLTYETKIDTQGISVKELRCILENIVSQCSYLKRCGRNRNRGIKTPDPAVAMALMRESHFLIFDMDEYLLDKCQPFIKSLEKMGITAKSSLYVEFSGRQFPTSLYSEISMRDFVIDNSEDLIELLPEKLDLKFVYEDIIYDL